MLVLSLFPGIGLLDRAFEEVFDCVVRGPDVLWGGDIRNFHPPAGRFDGIIGGPPCQDFSAATRMAKSNGHAASFGNLIPEFERCVAEADPLWFVMEQVKGAPIPAVAGYGIHSFLLNNRDLGESQNRLRRWSFGYRGERRLLLPEISVFHNPEWEPAVTAKEYGKAATVTVREKIGKNNRDWKHLCRLQGLPEDFDLPGMTRVAKGMAIGNGVPLRMGRAIARAVKEAIQES